MIWEQTVSFSLMSSTVTCCLVKVYGTSNYKTTIRLKFICHMPKKESTVFPSTLMGRCKNYLPDVFFGWWTIRVSDTLASRQVDAFPYSPVSQINKVSARHNTSNSLIGNVKRNVGAFIKDSHGLEDRYQNSLRDWF